MYLHLSVHTGTLTGAAGHAASWIFGHPSHTSTAKSDHERAVADAEAARAMTDALSHTAMAASSVNQTLSVLQTAAMNQLQQLYDLLGRNIAAEVADEGLSAADRELVDDYKKVGLLLGQLRNGTVGDTANSITTSLQGLLVDLKEVEQTLANRTSQKLKASLEQKVRPLLLLYIAPSLPLSLSIKHACTYMYICTCTYMTGPIGYGHYVR